MESAARKYSRQMDGLEFLVHTGPAPHCLMDTPDPEIVEDTSSVDSSLLSEPFSEYAPLEEPPEAGLQGQLTKFSPQFQATMQEFQVNTSQIKMNETRKASSSNKPAVKYEKVNWEKVVGGLQLELKIPPGLVPSEDEDAADDDPQLSLNCGRDETGMWRMLEQYTEFSLSLEESGASLGRTHHWLDQAQTNSGTRETALGTCASWLEKNVPVPQSRSRSVPSGQELQPVITPQEQPRAQTAKSFKDHEKSMWNKAMLAIPK